MDLTPRHLFRAHLTIIAALSLAFATVVILAEFGHRRLLGFSKLLHMGYETTLPTLIQVFALFAVALSAWLVRLRLPRGDVERNGWLIFAFTFAFLGFAESLKFHETVSAPFGFVGTLLYAGLAIPFGLIMFRFWLRQAPSIRWGMLGAGLLYLGAAVVMEIIEMNVVVDQGVPYHSLRVKVNVAIEEIGEMIAVALYLRVFLTRYAMLGGGPFLPIRIAAAGELPAKAYA